jgi:diacylglycerol O-acyltransferase
MKPLSGLDAGFLHLETPETPMHVASLHLFDLPEGYKGDFYDNIKRLLARRLHLAPIFRRKLAEMPLQFANPVWVETDDVDLDYHVQRLVLPRPGTQAQLEACAAAVHSLLLDRTRPLWRLYIIEGLQSGQAAYYIKVHHAVLDGPAGVLLAYALFDLQAKPHRLPPAPPAHEEHPGIGELAAAALRHDAAQYVKFVRHLPDVVRTLAGMVMNLSGGATGRLSQNFAFGPKTPFNVAITAERGFSAVSIPLAEMKDIAAAHGAKVNDVVLALCSTVLRRYLAHRGGIPRKPLIAAMPVSLRAAGDAEYTTQQTFSLVNLQSQLSDPIKRLCAIRDGASAMKSLVSSAKSVIPTDFPSIGVPWIMQGLAAAYGRSGLGNAIPPIANLVISNIPGPQTPLYAAGARMVTYWPLSAVEHGLGLNITVISYAGAMGFGFTTALSAVPDPRKLAEALWDAHEELKQKTRPAVTKTRKPPVKKAAAPSAPAKPAKRKAGIRTTT